MAHDVFISYSSKTANIALDICKTLEDNNIKCWIAPRNIPAGGDYGDIIEEAIIDCNLFLLVFSESATVSQWVRGELNLAFSENKHIIPYRVDQTPLKGALRLMLNQTHWIESFPDAKLKLNELRDSVASALNITPKIKTDSNSAPNGVDDIDFAYIEMLYNSGIAAALEFDINTAFPLLFKCAVHNYMDSQQQVCYIVKSTTRLYMIDKDNFDCVAEWCEKGNSFAQYVMGSINSITGADRDTQIKYIKLSAAQNNSYGIYSLSGLYEMGVFGKGGITKYKEYITKAVYMNNSDAILHLAKDYLYGWAYKQDNNKALELINKCIEMDNMEGCTLLGDLYFYGGAVERDLDKSVELYKRAISGGYLEAYVNLSNIYALDPDTYEFKDVSRGMEYIREGADKGVAGCISRLALAYYSGEGVQQNIRVALRWFTRASELGDKFALYMTGFIYYYGESGIKIDLSKAWDYLQKGRALSCADCNYLLGVICIEGCAEGDESEKDCIKYFEIAALLGGESGIKSALALYNIYRSKSLENEGVLIDCDDYVADDYDWRECDDGMAMKYLECAANLGDASSLYRYGALLSDIEGLFCNEFKGVRLLEQALNKGEKRAAARLGYLYAEGIVLPKDDYKAKEHYCIAANGGVIEAIVPYYSYIQDEITDYFVENKELLKWVNKGVEHKIPKAILDLGIFHHLGCYGVEQSFNRAIELYTEAANMGSGQAAINMGNMYYEGNEIEKDNDKAIYWLKKGVDCGVADDKGYLKELLNGEEYTACKGDADDSNEGVPMEVKSRGENDCDIFRDKSGSIIISIAAAAGGPESPKFVYDGGSTAILYRSKDTAITLRNISEGARESILNSDSVLVMECDGEDILREYSAEVKRVKSVAAICKIAGVKI